MALIGTRASRPHYTEKGRPARKSRTERAGRPGTEEGPRQRPGTEEPSFETTACRRRAYLLRERLERFVA